MTHESFAWLRRHEKPLEARDSDTEGRASWWGQPATECWLLNAGWVRLSARSLYNSHLPQSIIWWNSRRTSLSADHTFMIKVSSVPRIIVGNLNSSESYINNVNEVKQLIWDKNNRQADVVLNADTFYRRKVLYQNENVQVGAGNSEDERVKVTRLCSRI